MGFMHINTALLFKKKGQNMFKNYLYAGQA